MARGASWSPDGRWLVYADLNSVFISDANGANSREIWNANRVVEGWPRFSPDSKRIQVTVDGKTSNDSIADFRNECRWQSMFTHSLSIGRLTPINGMASGLPMAGISYLPRAVGGISSTYELVSPPWFEFWKKASAVRLTPEQMDVVAMTSTRDSTRLLVIGRVGAGIDAGLRF